MQRGPGQVFGAPAKPSRPELCRRDSIDARATSGGMAKRQRQLWKGRQRDCVGCGGNSGSSVGGAAGGSDGSGGGGCVFCSHKRHHDLVLATSSSSVCRGEGVQDVPEWVHMEERGRKQHNTEDTSRQTVSVVVD